MAIVNYSISGATGQNWTGIIDVSNTSNVVKTDTPTNITADSNAFTFVPATIQLYPASNDDNYVTWRTYNGPSQYPDSGYSFDVWSLDLYNAINGNSTWAQLISTGTYNLNTTKNTLMYDYNVPYSPYYGRGGTITFS